MKYVRCPHCTLRFLDIYRVRHLVAVHGYVMPGNWTGYPELMAELKEWRGQDLNLRPSGYEPDELTRLLHPTGRT